MSKVRHLANAVASVKSTSQVIAANATTPMDFGTPDDVDLRSFPVGSKVLVVVSAKRAAGTTSTLAFTVQDSADDGAGAPASYATAAISGTLPTFAADSGAVHASGVVAVDVKPGRPWLRVNAVHGVAGTDSFQAHCTVLGFQGNL